MSPSDGILSAAKTHYHVLQVSPTANYEAIKASYQRKVRQLHPDRRKIATVSNDDITAEEGCTATTRTQQEEVDGSSEMMMMMEESFLRLQKAWECLRDPQSRKDYDAELAIQQRQKTSSQPLTLEDDLELVEDEDTGDLCYLYTCRCGEELWLQQQPQPPPAIRLQKQQQQQPSDKAATTTVYMTCDGCSLVYHVVLLEDANS